MSNVIRAEFGSERYWQQAKQLALDNLVAIGARYGDDEALVRLKVDRAFVLLRAMCNEQPDVHTVLPPNLTNEQRATVEKAVQDGIVSATGHCVNLVMHSLIDLCTANLEAVRT